MDSDFDYNLHSSPMAESSFSDLPRKLKRLKKNEDVLHRSESVAFTRISLDSSGQLFSDPLHEASDNSLDFGFAHGMVKRALDFDSIENELCTAEDNNGPSKIVGEVSDPSTDLLEKKQNDDLDTNKRKFKRMFEIEEPRMKTKKKKTNNDEKEPTATIKKMTEKERKNQLQKLHAESQRLIRETSDLSFKPAPVVPKPINSILEKIRKRKSEVSKKPSFSNNNLSSHDLQMSANLEGDGKLVEEGTEDMSVLVTDLKHDKSIKYSDSSSVPLQDELVGEFKKADGDSLDTQNTFSKPEARNDSIEDSSEEHSSIGEVFAPSLLAMNLKLDPVPGDDECSSSDEDDNDKENIAPYPHGFRHSNSSENADPVKEFLDDEAEEEDDSDNDLRPPQSEEDSDSDNSEDFNDLIATGHEENKEDNEKRNQLHQKWLEQQDVNGTGNFLQRLRYGSRLRESFLDVDDENEGNVYEEFSNKSLMDEITNDSTGANSRKIKEMIPQMFTDKDDTFLSSDDEETEKRHAKLRARLHDDVYTTFSSVQEDDSCSEVFGLIKKLNVIPATKKNAKATGFLDMSLGGSSSSFSKASFVGRSSNRTLSSSHNQGSIKARFIFGRDDSNSMDAVSMPEDSYDKLENVGQQQQKPKQTTAVSDFGNLKFKGAFGNGNTKAREGRTTMTTPTTTPSLFKILRQSSLHSAGCSTEATFSESMLSVLGCTTTASSRSTQAEKMM